MRQKTRNNNIDSAKRPPQRIKPQPTRFVEEASKGRTWLHEIKLDGYRMHAGLDGGDIRLLTGTGLDWSDRHQAAISAFRALPLQNICLDAVMRSPSRWRDVLHIEFNDVADSAHHRAAIVDLSVVGLRQVEFGLLSRDVEREVLTGSSGRRSARDFRGQRAIHRANKSSRTCEASLLRRARAPEYIRKAPLRIRTAYRERIEQALSCTPLEPAMIG